MTYNKQLQGLVTKYIEAGEIWPATSHELAAWALKNKLWAPQRSEVINICAEQLVSCNPIYFVYYGIIMANPRGGFCHEATLPCDINS